MTDAPLSYPSRTARSQRGATLVIALILLLVMSLLAATSLRSTIMQERMSSNAYDRDIAFQAAEAGLRMGERQVEKWAKEGGNLASLSACTSPNTSKGFYNSTDRNTCKDALWEGPAPGTGGSFWHDAGSDSGTDDIKFTSDKLSLAPYYIIELIANRDAPCLVTNPELSMPTCRRFRVTATSRVADGRAQVILQSIYATQ